MRYMEARGPSLRLSEVSQKWQAMQRGLKVSRSTSASFLDYMPSTSAFHWISPKQWVLRYWRLLEDLDVVTRQLERWRAVKPRKSFNLEKVRRSVRVHYSVTESPKWLSFYCGPVTLTSKHQRCSHLNEAERRMRQTRASVAHSVSQIVYRGST